MTKSSSAHRGYQRLLRERSHIKKIVLEIIPHSSQRYETVGDWKFEEDGTLKISVSEMSNGRYEQCVQVHELIEVLLCRLRGITQKQVDDFDMEYERNRKPGDESEPGDHKDAPYRREHFFATTVERMLAAECGIDWEAYDKEINAL